ncbi:MAG: twin-arginine translocase subunit TatC [SAR324 cluster bacterium]|uniref:Sec-independent protein translocase protein TatC n=1 Tax=SAR324 cluster bacterium TaxID=2024889 RepID=A0A7X9IJD9_9DELT|nr:twin-arginine translocase subunit TatC [SAR324 cluster bacterium]
MNEHLETTTSELTFIEHLRELRSRLLISLLFVLCGTFICYFIAPWIFSLLNAPYYRSFPENSIIGTSPAEAIMLRISVSFFGGALLVSPFIFHQLWLFVAPGLHSSERRLALPFVILSTALFVLGVLFCYLVVLPLAMHFFVQQYKELGLSPQVRMSEHLSLILHLLIAFGLIFEMPVLAIFLAKAKILEYHSMLSWSRHAIVLIFVVAAILTPPDVISQLAMAFPLMGLF